MKKYTAISTERQKKYQQYYQLKMMNVKILPSDQSRIIEQANFTYSALGKPFEK